jgi:hypothetical protein
MHVYFVNCDDLRPILAIHGITGEWSGDDDYLEFTGANGEMLCWLARRCLVLAGGENVRKLIESVPELVPWAEAMVVVGKRLEDMQALKDEVTNLRRRLRLSGINMQVRWRDTYESLQSIVRVRGMAGKWFEFEDHKEFVSKVMS